MLMLDQSEPDKRIPVQCGGSFAERSVFDLFATIAARQPDAIAIQDGAQTLSYGAALAICRRLAARVAQVPHGSGAIGLLLPNGALYPLAVLACLATGRPFVALDLHYPAERNALLIGQARLDALLTPGAAALGGLALPPDLPCIDAAAIAAAPHDASDDGAAAFVATPAGPDAPALIIYTSGSSGTPKGVVNSQYAILQRALQHIATSDIGPRDCLCPLSSPSTISGVREQMAALLSGARLQVIDPQRAGLRDIRRTLREAGVTVVYVVPSLLRTLLQLGGDACDFATLRVVRSGGDRVLWGDIALLAAALPPGGRIQIGFSSTEAPGLQWFVPRDRPAEGSAPPIGYPVPELQVILQGEDGTPVPLGEAGEIVLQGRGVALGYWRDGQVVAGPFRPVCGQPLVRRFATGDMVRLRADGLYETAGRRDRQIKVRGQRVDPTELEALLRGAPGVADASVIPVTRPDPLTRQDQAVLVAFVATAPHAPADADAGLVARLLARIDAGLPSAMRPAAIHRLPAIPRLPSGKPDGAALAALHDRLQPAPEAVSADAIPAANVAAAVRDVWRRVLGRSVLGRGAVEDGRSWVDAGGDSLKLLQFVFMTERALRLQLPVELFSGDMTLADCIAAIGRIAQRDERDAADATDGRATVFLMPGIDGDEPLLALLRRDLQPAMRFVLLDYPSLAEMAAERRFELVVERALQQVLAQAPSGTIRLAGYSYGGVVALAVARRLLAHGREVGFLGVIDAALTPGGPDDPTRNPASARLGSKGWLGKSRLSRQVALLHDNAQRFGWTDSAFYLASRLLARPRAAGLLRRLLAANGAASPQSGRSLFLLHRHLRISLRMVAKRRWLAQTPLDRAPLNITLFRSAAHGPEAPADLGWSAVCQWLEVVQLQGDHHGILEQPHRAALAQGFVQALHTSGAPAPCRESSRTPA